MIFVVPQSNQAITTFAQQACGYAGEMRAAMTGFGFTSAGEVRHVIRGYADVATWSLAVNGNYFTLRSFS